jgi:hypothetical protein
MNWLLHRPLFIPVSPLESNKMYILLLTTPSTGSHLIHVIWSRNQDEIPSHDQTDGSLIQFQATEQMSQF